MVHWYIKPIILEIMRFRMQFEEGLYIYRIYIHNYFLLKHGALVHQADNFGNNALSNAIRGRFIYIYS